MGTPGAWPAGWSGAPQLNRDVFTRGRAEEPVSADRATPAADSAALLRACLAVLQRPERAGAYRPAPLLLWRFPDALARLRRLLPAIPAGAPLERFLPAKTAQGPMWYCGAARRWPACCWPGWKWAPRALLRSRRE